MTPENNILLESIFKKVDSLRAAIHNAAIPFDYVNEKEVERLSDDEREAFPNTKREVAKLEKDASSLKEEIGSLLPKPRKRTSTKLNQKLLQNAMPDHLSVPPPSGTSSAPFTSSFSSLPGLALSAPNESAGPIAQMRMNLTASLTSLMDLMFQDILGKTQQQQNTSWFIKPLEKVQGLLAKLQSSDSKLAETQPVAADFTTVYDIASIYNAECNLLLDTGVNINEQFRSYITIFQNIFSHLHLAVGIALGLPDQTEAELGSLLELHKQVEHDIMLLNAQSTRKPLSAPTSSGKILGAQGHFKIKNHPIESKSKIEPAQNLIKDSKWGDLLEWMQKNDSAIDNRAAETILFTLLNAKDKHHAWALVEEIVISIMTHLTAKCQGATAAIPKIYDVLESAHKIPDSIVMILQSYANSLMEKITPS